MSGQVIGTRTPPQVRHYLHGADNPGSAYVVLVQLQWKLLFLISLSNPPLSSSIISDWAGLRHDLSPPIYLQVQSSRAPPRDQVSDYSSGYVVRLQLNYSNSVPVHFVHVLHLTL